MVKINYIVYYAYRKNYRSLNLDHWKCIMKIWIIEQGHEYIKQWKINMIKIQRNVMYLEFGPFKIYYEIWILQKNKTNVGCKKPNMWYKSMRYKYIISTKKVSVLWKDLIDWKWYDSKVLLIASKIYEAAVWNTNYLQITKCIKIMMVSFYFGEGKMQFLCPSTKIKIKK